MSKKIQQINSDNQFAFVDSDNNVINIINNPKQYLEHLLKNGNIDEAAEYFSEVIEMMNKAPHPMYPMYYYKPIIMGSKVLFEHKASSEEFAQKYPLEFRGNFSFDRNLLKDGESFQEMVTRKRLVQEKVSIDVKWIETWIGEKLIDEASSSFAKHAVENADWFIHPGKARSPLKVKLVIEEVESEVLIDYLELSVTDVDFQNNMIEISNKRQDLCPIVFTILMPNILKTKATLSNETKFDLKIRECYEGSVMGEKFYLEIMQGLNRCTNISILDLESHRTIIYSDEVRVDNPVAEDFEVMNSRIEVLSLMKQIEGFFDVQFQLPKQMEEFDLEAIEILTSIVNQKEIISNFESLSIKFNDVEEIKRLINDVGEKPVLFSGKQDLDFELAGKNFNNITLHQSYDNAVIQDIEKIKNKVKHFDSGDTISVTFAPGTNNRVISEYSLND